MSRQLARISVEASGTCFEKYEYARDWLQEVLDAPRIEDFDLRADLETAVIYWRGVSALADPIWDIKHNFYVRDEIRRVPVLYGHEDDYAQNLLWDSVEADRLAGKPARKIGVKPRRIRWSSASLAYGLQMCLRNEGHGAAVVAHDEPTAGELFNEVAKFAFENLPEPKPEKKYSTRKELEFLGMGSKIRIGTAAAGAGSFAGFAIMFAQWTEAARYEEKGCANPADLINTVRQAMPPPPAFTVDIMEFTGRGQRGYAYREAKREHDSPGSTGADLLFIPAYRRPNAVRWFCQHESREKPECDCWDSRRERAKLRAALTDEERLLMAEPHMASLEFINWRRWVFDNEIKGDTYGERRRNLLQEHCCTFWDAFGASGATLFDPELVSTLMKHPRCKDLTEIQTRGELESSEPMWTPTSGVSETTPAPKFVYRSTGDLYVLKRPVPGHRYGFALDMSGGIQSDDRDWHAAPVLDRDDMECVALYYSQVPLHVLHGKVRLLSRWYNDAFIGPEVGTVDDFTEHLGRTDRRPFMYVRREGRDKIADGVRTRLGWKTNQANKMTGVAALADAMVHHPQFFTFKILLEQMLTLSGEELRSGKIRVAAATKSDRDDVFMASQMVLQQHRDMPMYGDSPHARKPDAEERRAEPTLTEKVSAMFKAQQAEQEVTASDYDAAMD